MLLALAAIFLASWVWEVTGTSSPPSWVHLLLAAGVSAVVLYACGPGTRVSQTTSDEAYKGRRAASLLRTSSADESGSPSLRDLHRFKEKFR